RIASHLLLPLLLTTSLLLLQRPARQPSLPTLFPYTTLFRSFHKKDVEAYNQLFKQSNSTDVSPLYCASLWPEFELFKPFISSKLLLKSTEIEQYHPLAIDVIYQVQLTLIEQKRIRQFIK